MTKKAFNLFFKEELIKEPIMFLAARDCDLMLNVRLAKITAHSGEATIELEGEEANIEKAVQQMRDSGVDVSDVVDNLVDNF